MKYVVEVAYIKEDGTRAVMSYTTSYPEYAKAFASYYRPKVGNGTYLSVKSSSQLD